MASPANINSPMAYSGHSGSQAHIPSASASPHPIVYIPRGTHPEHHNERSREYGNPNYSAHGQSHDHNGARSDNKSPVAGTTASQIQGKPQTVFIHKLYDMLEDPSLTHLIWWTAAEDSFCLYPGEEFSNVLASYFKHTNIASFIRQLNMYGFHKVNDNLSGEEKALAPDANGQPPQPRWEFRHSASHFRKGDLDSLSLIKRKSSKVMGSKDIVSMKTLPPTSGAQDEKSAAKDPQTQEQYHSSVYQQSWTQLGGPSGSRNPSAGSEAGRQAAAVYTPMMGQYAYPMYAQGMPIPHSPNSPVGSEQHASPSYFLHSTSQPQSRQTSLQTPSISHEQSVNFKMMELNTTVNGLQVAYSDLLARHESLSAMYHKSQGAFSKLNGVVDRLSARVKESEEALQKSREKDDVVDRKMTKTPKFRVVSPGPDSMSPNTVRPRLDSDTPGFMPSLVSKAAASGQTPSPRPSGPVPNGPVPNGPVPTSSVPGGPGHKKQPSYHLSEEPQARAVAHGVVPQSYPLNPNYTLYNSARLAGEENSAARPALSRNVSVFMDPLQPASHASAQAQTQAQTQTQTQTQMSASRKSPAPREVINIEEEKPKTPGAEASSTFVQQYQPYQPAHAYYQHMVHDPSQLRTSSLPTMVHPSPLKVSLAAPQRHSLTSILHHGSTPEEPRPRIPSTSSQTPKHVGPGAEQAAEKRAEETTAPKVFLPSMEELNKSLRTGSPTNGMFGMHPAGSADDDVKRRKLE